MPCFAYTPPKRMAHTCTSCGARIDPSLHACPYCGTVTPAGAAARAHGALLEQQKARFAAEQEHARRVAEIASLGRSATAALYWSVAGLVFCCIPVPAVVALVLAYRTQATAKRLGVSVPVQTIVAYVFGALALLTFTSAAISATLDARRLAQRKEALAQRIEKGAGAPSLDHDTACALAELSLLQDGWAKTSGSQIEAFDCAGKLELQGDRLALGGIRFKTSSTQPVVTVTACLARGGRWYVASMHEGDDRCD